MTTPLPSSSIADVENEKSKKDANISVINDYLLNTKAEIDIKQSEIQKKSSQITEKQQQVYGQSQEIEDKIKLLDTRNKMLQLSIDQNIYKKKVIYSLLSVIIALIVGMLFFYTFFTKKINME